MGAATIPLGLREKFEKGEIVLLDKEYRNRSFVVVEDQTPGQLYTVVNSENEKWTVMTNRLTPTRNIDLNDDIWYGHLMYYYICWMPQLAVQLVKGTYNKDRNIVKVRFVNMNHEVWIQIDYLRIIY